MKDIVQLLADHDISPTHQRVQIASMLFAKPQHLSADQVMSMVNGERAVVSKATVYNTLGLFARKGLVREVIIDPNKVFYDSSTHPHYHFYNVDTGEVSDVEISELDIANLPGAPEGTTLETVDVILKVRNA